MYKQQIINFNSISTAPKNFYHKNNGKSISYETYFNILDYKHLAKFCEARSCYLDLVFKGSGKIFIYNRTEKNKQILIDKIELNSKTEKHFTSNEYEFDSFAEEGYLFIEVENVHSFVLLNSFFCVPTRNDKVTKNCVVICTYKREKYVLENVENLYKYCRNFVDRVFVIDNGNSLSIGDKYKDFLSVIPNKNYGGSGGFSRGMYEAYNNGFTHMLLMDDDISFNPESIYRGFNLVRNFSDSHKDDWVGYSMFPFNKPTKQHEMGSNWDGRNVKSNNYGFDLSKKEYLLKNLKDKTYQYSAWWSLIMPTNIVKKQGLSLPLFIKMDDIEYALRGKEGEIYFSNGLGVWHESFDSKYNVALEYYIYRNALIVNAIHLKRKVLYCIYRYVGKCINNLIHGHIREWELYNLALKHFLKGPRLFYKLDAEQNHKKINNLAKRKRCPFLISFYLFFQTIYLFIISVFKWRYITKKFRKDYRNICSIEYWEKVLSIK